MDKWFALSAAWSMTAFITYWATMAVMEKLKATSCDQKEHDKTKTGD